MKKVGVYILTVVFLISCNTKRYLPSPSEFKYHVKGLYIACNVEAGNKVSGELISVDSQALLVRPLDGLGGLRKITKDELSSAEIHVSQTLENSRKIKTWATYLGASTLLHGAYLIFTLPINMVVFSGMTNEGGIYRISYPNQIDWDELKKFARFPQGVPNHLSANQIQ